MTVNPDKLKSMVATKNGSEKMYLSAFKFQITE